MQGLRLAQGGIRGPRGCGLRDREAEVPCAPSDPVPSRAPGLCWIRVSHPGCREGAQGSRVLPALHDIPPVLEPEARWGPSPHREVGQGSENGVTARHPRWSVSQEGASGGGKVGGCEPRRWAWRSRLPALTWHSLGHPPGVPGGPSHRGQWCSPRNSCMEAQLSSQDTVQVS